MFFNRNLKRLVAVELKRGRFRADFNGQMKLYLKWLNRYERADGENEPIGLILCAEGNRSRLSCLRWTRTASWSRNTGQLCLRRKNLRQRYTQF
ncbi:MAG: DUF1016 domain-containing protein [Clostridiales bacterium]|nr:DUF1016 domain-containing protein [Clostridiales bacterium]